MATVGKTEITARILDMLSRAVLIKCAAEAASNGFVAPAKMPSAPTAPAPAVTMPVSVTGASTKPTAPFQSGLRHPLEPLHQMSGSSPGLAQTGGFAQAAPMVAPAPSAMGRPAYADQKFQSGTLGTIFNVGMNMSGATRTPSLPWRNGSSPFSGNPLFNSVSPYFNRGSQLAGEAVDNFNPVVAGDPALYGVLLQALGNGGGAR